MFIFTAYSQRFVQIGQKIKTVSYLKCINRVIGRMLLHVEQVLMLSMGSLLQGGGK